MLYWNINANKKNDYLHKLIIIYSQDIHNHN